MSHPSDDAFGIARGLDQIDYQTNRYRARIRNAAGDTVLVSVHELTMSGAIKDSHYLACYFKSPVSVIRNFAGAR